MERAPDVNSSPESAVLILSLEEKSGVLLGQRMLAHLVKNHQDTVKQMNFQMDVLLLRNMEMGIVQ